MEDNEHGVKTRLYFFLKTTETTILISPDGSNDYYRFANTIIPLAHEARRDPDTAQRQGIYISTIPTIRNQQ